MVTLFVRAILGIHDDPTAWDYAGATVILVIVAVALAAVGYGAAEVAHGIIRRA